MSIILRPWKHLLGMRLPAPLFGGAALALLALAPSAHSQAAPPSPSSERAVVEGIIRDYILKNPEIIQEALVELERRQQEAQQNAIRRITADPQSPLYVSANHTVVGNPNGDVTIVEFFDFNCGFCKRGLADIQKILDTDKNVRIILKEFPILSPGSREAAAVALALREQFDAAKLWLFHSTLLQMRGQIGKEQALTLAKEMGADVAKLTASSASPAINQALEETMNLGEILSITGTPSYVVAEELVIGARGYETLVEKISNYRKCKKSVC